MDPFNSVRHWRKVITYPFSTGNYVFFLLTHNLSFFPSYGTAKSGVGISAMAVLRPDQMIKCSVPVIMAGIIAVSFFFATLHFRSDFVLSTRPCFPFSDVHISLRFTVLSCRYSSRGRVCKPFLHTFFVSSTLTTFFFSPNKDVSSARFYSTWCWPVGRSRRSGRWFCCWHCWRCWCTRHSSTTSALCRHGACLLVLTSRQKVLDNVDSRSLFLSSLRSWVFTV